MIETEREVISQAMEVWSHLVQYGSVSIDGRKADERLLRYLNSKAVVDELEEWISLEGCEIYQRGSTIYRVPNPETLCCANGSAAPYDTMENLLSYIVLFALNELLGGTGTNPLVAEFIKIEDLHERLTRFFSVVSTENPDQLDVSPYSRTMWDMATMWMGKPMIDEEKPDSTAKDTQRGIINKAITGVRAYGIFYEDRQYKTIGPSQKTRDLLPVIFAVSRKKDIQKKLRELAIKRSAEEEKQEV